MRYRKIYNLVEINIPVVSYDIVNVSLPFSSIKYQQKDILLVFFMYLIRFRIPTVIPFWKLARWKSTEYNENDDFNKCASLA
jgi:hypothetical protein